MLITTVVMLAVTLSWGQAAEADVVSHICGNPSHEFRGGRTALCGDLERVTDVGTTFLVPGGQFFCQITGGDHHLIPCAGAAWLVELYHQPPGQSGFTLLLKSQTDTCGSFNGRPGARSIGACPRARNQLRLVGVSINPPQEPVCTRYYSRARASFQLPGDPATIEGAAINSGIWLAPSCRV